MVSARAIHFAAADVRGDSTSEQPYSGIGVQALCTCSEHTQHGWQTLASVLETHARLLAEIVAEVVSSAPVAAIVVWVVLELAMMETEIAAAVTVLVEAESLVVVTPGPTEVGAGVVLGVIFAVDVEMMREAGVAVVEAFLAFVDAQVVVEVRGVAIVHDSGQRSTAIAHSSR